MLSKVLEKTEGFAYLKWGEGFFIGMLVVLLLALATPAKTKIVEVPIIRVVEKAIVVKEPIYLNQHDKNQIQCLAENAYYEAGNQSTKGKIAVTNVVMNRVQDKRFPKTPCAVIHQKRGKVCQFSWVCEGHKRIRDWAEYVESRRVAEQVYLNNVGDVTNGSKFYHANYVNPGWNLKRITQIGSHIFYRG